MGPAAVPAARMWDQGGASSTHACIRASGMCIGRIQQACGAQLRPAGPGRGAWAAAAVCWWPGITASTWHALCSHTTVLQRCPAAGLCMMCMDHCTTMHQLWALEGPQAVFASNIIAPLSEAPWSFPCKCFVLNSAGFDSLN